MMNKFNLGKTTLCYDYFNGTVTSERIFVFLLSFDIFPTNFV